MPVPFSRGHQKRRLAHGESFGIRTTTMVSFSRFPLALAAAWATLEDGVLPVLLRMRPVQAEIGKGLTRPIPVGYRW